MIRTWSRKIRRVGLVTCCFLIAGCSVPQSIDPRRLFDDEPAAAETEGGEELRERASDETAAAGEEPFPALATVPDRPTPPTPRQIRERVLEGLVADRDNARYTDEVVRRREAADEVVVPAARTQPPAESSAAPAPEASLAAAEKAPPESTPEPATDPQVAKVEPPAPPARVEPAAAAVPAVAAAAAAAAAAAPPPAAAPAPPAAPEPVLTSRTDQVETPAVAPAAPQLAAVQPTARAPEEEDIFAASVATGALPLATIQFTHGSARLSQADRDILLQAATVALQERAGVMIVGHSSSRSEGDAVRKRLANFEESIERANVVAAALVEFGVNPDRIIVEAKAEQQPRYRETASTGEAGNRRAELYLIR